MALAVHIILVGCDKSPNPPVARDNVFQYADHLLRRTGMCCPAPWFGRILHEALFNECDFDQCTINHSRALLSADGKTLANLRFSVPSDFVRKKPTRRYPHPSVPACAEAYEQLVPHVPRLCPDVLSDDHDTDDCNLIHLRNLTSAAPLPFEKIPSAQTQAISVVLNAHVERARKDNGDLDAKAKVFSSELLDIAAKALADASLPPIIRCKKMQGGLFSRHGIGRAICKSEFWGKAQRDGQARAFRGFRIKRKIDTAQLHCDLLHIFGDQPAAAAPPASAPSLPAVPASAGTVSLSSDQYSFLISNARAHLQQQTAAAADRVAAIDKQLASLQAERAAAAAEAARNRDQLARLCT